MRLSSGRGHFGFAAAAALASGLFAACSPSASDSPSGPLSGGVGGGAFAGETALGNAGRAAGGAAMETASGAGGLTGIGEGTGGAATSTVAGSASASAAGALGSAGSANAGSVAGAAGGTALAPFKGVANSPCAARTALNVSWYYNWTQGETEPCTNGAGGEFVPMVWGHVGAERSATGIDSAVAGFVSKGFGYVLGFNEPDNATQSHIASDEAITLLPSFNHPGIRVGTPATQANMTGQAWFRDYMSKVAANASLRQDFIAIHWYGWDAGSCDASASQLEGYLKYAEGFAGNREIWLTEWACLNLSAPTPEGVLAFYKGALAVFAKHPRLRRYAWYPWTKNCELNKADGSLTPLGVEYAAAAAQR